ncbi:DUF551 domain-containing protein [Vibrio parahaemolyticus]|nr:DUF551 domain-containing protein [Vibrio parahaemolyticus]
MSDLKPCPFCGEIPTHEVIPQSGMISGYEIIRCENCDITKHSCSDWNTRHSGWVSVNEALPSDKTSVICHCNEGHVSEMYYHNGGFDFPRDDIYPDDYDLVFLSNITHWMYTPKVELEQ